ncbi:DUF2905 domain-containing protein [Adhaeribacter pallidiroseus]|uniref:DUF2905 domain-containing protein n=1 Tax=Adhaeribacter pallidiroseus TaxID=2072847 RepID=A0A369QKY6_9BACT|nr:DUF2905 domain-containing protein [Adhaeribacter pallidiroseus]RDC63917.1 hypothetical protein AHMF7616_02526 [Adhaeribacter pallidiroseus]
MQPVGKYLVFLGLILVGVGLLFWLAGNRFNWFGHLPGDIRIEKPNFKFYAPLTSMLLISILFSFIMWLVRRFF